MKTKITLILILFIVLCGYSPINRNVLTDIYKGDTKNYEFTVKDVYTNSVINLTGYIVKFRVKKNETDSTYVIDKSCTVTTPATGIATVALTAVDTTLPIYQYTAYVVLTNTGGTIYKTMLKSKLSIIQ